MAAHDNEFYITVLEKLVRRSIMPGIWVVHGAMRTGLSRGLVTGRLCSLHKGDDLQIRMGRYEGQVEAFGRESVSYDTDFDWCHCCVREINTESR